MDAYMYDAAFYCKPCGLKIIAEIIDEIHNSNKDGAIEETAAREALGDSALWPQSYADGGGEADAPQHCDACGAFLENPLTRDGYAFVREAVESGWGSATEWAPFYGITLKECVKCDAPIPSPTLADGEDERCAACGDDYENDDGIICPVCSGPGAILGALGNRTHYRCRDCGVDFSKGPTNA